MHIGHAKTYIVWDVVIRYLQYLGYKVYHVSNISDVSIDDKILRRIRELGISYQQLVEKFTRAYFKDRKALGIAHADVHPLVTQHIQEVIELVEKLVEKGYAYIAKDGVYFNIRKFKEYGKLSGVKISKLKPGASSRVKTDEYDKAEVSDFALWKKAKPGEPYWYSPWGKGRPGWHIECSTLAMKYLGETIDIHAGGEDNIFPHHENEIAQSEALTRKLFTKYWLHTRHVSLNGWKMSKSEKNYITARGAITKYGSALLRFHLLTVHYRNQLDFREQDLAGSKRSLQRLKDAVATVKRFAEKGLEKVENMENVLLEAMDKAKEDFEKAMNDDFNTPTAINAISDMAKTINQYLQTHRAISKENAKKIFRFFNETGTILLGDLFEKEIVPKIDWKLEKLIETLIKERENARKRGDYQTADKIRYELTKLGVRVEDTPQKTIWRLENVIL